MKAKLPFTPSEVGAFQIRARYAVGNLYSGSVSEPVTLDVYINYTMYAVAGSMAAITLIIIRLQREDFKQSLVILSILMISQVGEQE